MRWRFISGFVVTAAVSSFPAFAQAPEPPKIWTVAAGAGLALTNGNKDTSTVNASYDVTYDPQTGNIVKSDGLFLRGSTDGDVSADRLGLNGRDQYKLGPHVYVFGQNQYVRDRFKNIDYLLAPTGGIGFQAVDTQATKLGVDGGIGGVWEKDRGFPVNSSGAVALGEKVTHTLTATTTVTQSYSGLWKTKDFADALHVFNLGLAAAMSTRTQLKVELLDTYQHKPRIATTQKNDVAVLVGIVYKM